MEIGGRDVENGPEWSSRREMADRLSNPPNDNVKRENLQDLHHSLTVEPVQYNAL